VEHGLAGVGTATLLAFCYCGKPFNNIALLAQHIIDMDAENTHRI
jgi:hypothetical protein